MFCAIFVLAPPVDAAPGDGCKTQACRARVQHEVRQKWRVAVHPYRAWLRSTRSCESRGAGGYSLDTTGNGFWFAYQFTPSTWRSVAGGRVSGGRPVGLWSTHPTPLEQDYRAVRVLAVQGVKAWPVCG